MAHKTHMKAQIVKPKKLAAATPYSYFGRTHDKGNVLRSGMGTLHNVNHGHSIGLRRSGVVGNVTRHGIKSWLERGGGHGASYKD